MPAGAAILGVALVAHAGLRAALPGRGAARDAVARAAELSAGAGVPTGSAVVGVLILPHAGVAAALLTDDEADALALVDAARAHGKTQVPEAAGVVAASTVVGVYEEARAEPAADRGPDIGARVAAPRSGADLGRGAGHATATTVRFSVVDAGPFAADEARQTSAAPGEAEAARAARRAAGPTVGAVRAGIDAVVSTGLVRRRTGETRPRLTHARAVAGVPAGAAVLVVAAEVQALTAAGLRSTRAGTAPALAGLTREAGVGAGSAVAWVRALVHAGAIAERLTRGAGLDALAVHARVAGVAGLATGATVQGVVAGVHTCVRAGGRAGGADAGPGGTGSAHVAEVAAGAAIRSVRAHLGADTLADEPAVWTAASACGADASLRASLAAGAAALGVGLEVHAGAVAEHGADRTHARALVALLSGKARRATAAAVVGVLGQVVASVRARGASCKAGPLTGAGPTLRLGSTGAVAGTAMERVTAHVHARSSAGDEAGVAVVDALAELTELAGATAESAGAAVLRIIVEQHARGGAGIEGRQTGAAPVQARLRPPARLAAGAAVVGIRRDVHAAAVALGIPAGARRDAGPLRAQLRIPAAVTAGTTIRAIRGEHRAEPAAVSLPQAAGGHVGGDATLLQARHPEWTRRAFGDGAKERAGPRAPRQCQDEREPEPERRPGAHHQSSGGLHEGARGDVSPWRSLAEEFTQPKNLHLWVEGRIMGS